MVSHDGITTPGLQLRLLGASQIALDGRPVAGLTSVKAQATLYYLAATGRPHARSSLAPLLWGDVTDAAARANLRKALQQLREHLAPWLVISRDSIALASDASCWVDVIEFDTALRDTGDVTDRLRQALDLYRGDFLQGFYVRNAPDFETWWLSEQARLRELALSGLNRLADQYVERGELDKAIACARRYLSLEPWREGAHFRLMMWLARDGQRGAALAQYDLCRQTLADELSVEPAAATTALHGRIRDGTMVPVRPSPQPDPAVRQRPPYLDDRSRPPSESHEPLVGRETQLGQLTRLMELAHGGQGAVAFVSGEAGWGKTSLLAEFTRLAQKHDPSLIVASGICTTSTGAGDPYLPFRGILQMLAADIEQKWAAGTISHDHALRLWHFFPQVLDALLTRGRQLIGSFVAGDTLLQRAQAHETIEKGPIKQLSRWIEETRGQRFAGDQEYVFEQFSDVLLALASQRPLLLVLDDLHWADASSINLLFHLGRRIKNSPVMILGAYRPEEVTQERDGSKHPLVGTLNEFRRMFGDVWVHLDQTQPDAARAFVDALLDVEPNRLEDDFRNEMSLHTGAHPLFIVETMRDMRERGDLLQDTTGHWVTRSTPDWNILPARVEGVIETRIRRLDASLRRFLVVASVEGETFTAQAIASISGVDERELVRVLDRDADKRHRLVQENGTSWVNGQRLSTYRFRHNLFQRYLYSSLSASERGFLHEDVGNALEQLHGSGADGIAVELAYHFQTAGIPEKAIHYLIQAGNQAIQLSAHDAAIAHLTRGLELLNAMPCSADRDREELSLRISLGAAQRYAGQISAALETYQRSAAIARELEAVDDLALAALGFEDTRWRYNLPAASAIQLLTEALDALGEDETVLRVRVLGGLTRAFMVNGAPVDLETMARQAVASARRLDDPLALYDTLRNYLFVNRRPESSDMRIAAADEMVQLAEAIENRERLAEALGSRSHEHLERGDIRAAYADMEHHERLGHELGQPFFLHISAMFRATRLILAGEFEEAEQQAQQALQIGQRIGTENAAGAYGIQMFSIRREQGRLHSLAPVIKHFVEQNPASATWLPGLALIYSDLGAVREARAVLDQLAVDDFAGIPRDAFWVSTLAYLSEVCTTLHDAKRAALLYPLLLPYDGRAVIAGFATVCYGAVSRFLGLLAMTLSRWDEAERHFSNALQMNSQMDARPWLAYTQHQYAAMLLTRRNVDNHARASSMLDAAVLTATELSMSALADKAAALIQKTPA